MEQLMAELQPIIISTCATVLTAIGAYLGKLVGDWIKEKINTETKEKIVATTCKYVQQVYKDLDAETKFEKAREDIVIQLNEKGIKITELELKALIEATVYGIKQGLNQSKVESQKVLENKE